MHRTLQDRLLDEFLRWDALGRGHTAWDACVVPEPYFVPFPGHGAFTERQGFADEGLCDGLVSGFLRRFREPVPPSPAQDDPFFSADSGEAPDFLREDDEPDLEEALWTVPDSVKWKLSDFEPFLYSLGGAARPVCFEILAVDGELSLQWVADRDDRSAVSDAISNLPFGSTLEWRKDHLASTIFEKKLPLLWSRDLALERPFVLPIRSEFPADPLAEVLSRLAELGSDALGIVQVRFQPCTNPWAESMFRLATTSEGKPFVLDGVSFLDETKAKCRKPLYAATIRIAVLGDSEEALEGLCQSVVRPFSRFDDDNGFVLADDYDLSFEDTIFELINRRSRRSGMILNGDELLCLVHPPAAGAGSPALARLRRRTWPAPAANVTAADLALGICRHGGTAVECGLRTADRLRHVHVLGGSGTGKSTLLLNMILQDLEAGHGLALLDPHGDLVDAVLDHLPESRVGDVAIFDPADEEWPVGFNILRAHNDIERHLIASDFVAIFERLSTSWGDQMTTVLGNASMAFLTSDQGGTILDLKRFLIEKGFRERFLKTVRDPEIRYFWTHEFPQMRGGTDSSLSSRLNGFLRHPLVRNIIAQKGERFDVAGMMDHGKVILAKLSQGLIGEENSWLLGSLLVAKVHQAALSRQAQDQATRRPFFLYMDEAHNFVTPSIAAILSGARKFGLGLVLAHQDLDQFPSRENGILASILSNCHTRVYFRLGDKDAKKLDGGFDHFSETDLRRLRTGEAICRVGASDADFSLDCPPLPAPPHDGAERRARAVDQSRATYSTPRSEVASEAQSPAVNCQPPKERHARKADPYGEADRPAKGTHHPEADSSFPSATDLIPDPQIPEVDPPSEDGKVPPDPMTESEPPAPDTKKPRTPGRGGTRHTFIQRTIVQYANGLGLGAEIEREVADKSGAVDVLVSGQSLCIAFEVAVESPLDQELKNIVKALASGIASVVVVADEEKHLEAIRAYAEDRGIRLPESVEFLRFDRLGDYFSNLGATLSSYETSSRGYKVRVRQAPMSPEEEEERRAAIHRAIAQHQRERREGPSSSDGVNGNSCD
jgi:hypothetical protein